MWGSRANHPSWAGGQSALINDNKNFLFSTCQRKSFLLGIDWSIISGNSSSNKLFQQAVSSCCRGDSLLYLFLFSVSHNCLLENVVVVISNTSCKIDPDFMMTNFFVKKFIPGFSSCFVDDSKLCRRNPWYQHHCVSNANQQ
jgi:hypothetical protein